MTDHEQRIRELLDLRSGLQCLPAIWRKQCLTTALTLTPEQQARYIQEQLEPLRKCVEPLTLNSAHFEDEHSFAANSSRVVAATSIFNIALLLDCQEFAGEDFLDTCHSIATSYRLGPGKRLVAAAIAFAWPEVPTESGIVNIAWNLFRLGVFADTINFLTSALDLSGLNIRDSAQFLNSLSTSVIFRRLELRTRNDLVWVVANIVALRPSVDSNSLSASIILAYLKDEIGGHRLDGSIENLYRKAYEDVHDDSHSRLLISLAGRLDSCGQYGAGTGAKLLDDYLLPTPVLRVTDSTRTVIQFCHLSPNMESYAIWVRASMAQSAPEQRRLVSFLERKYSLTTSDYENPERLRDRFRVTFDRDLVEGDNRSNFAWQFARLLSAVTERGAPIAVAVLEAYVGIAPGDYLSAIRLRSIVKDEATLAGIMPGNQCLVIAELAIALTLTSSRGPTYSWRLIEAVLQISSADYCDANSIRIALANSSSFKRFSLVHGDLIVNCLADALRLDYGRGPSHSIALVEGVLGLTIEHYDSDSQLRSAVDRIQQERPGTQLLRRLGDALLGSSFRGARFTSKLSRAVLGINESDFLSGSEMDSALLRARDRWRSTAGLGKAASIGEINNWSIELWLFATALREQPRDGAYRAIQLLTSYLRVFADEVSALTPNNRSLVLMALAEAYLRATEDFSGHAVQVLESALNLNPGMYCDEQKLAATLLTVPAFVGLSANNRVLLLKSLFVALARLGGDRRGDSVRLFRGLVGGSLAQFASATVFQGVNAGNVVSFIQQLLNQLDANQEAYTTCKAFVEYVRSVRTDQLRGISQKADFIKSSIGAWPSIQRIVLNCVGQERGLGSHGEKRAEEMLSDFHLWSEQFHNRILVERLLLLRKTVGRDADSALKGWGAQRWALSYSNDEEAFVSQQAWSSLAQCWSDVGGDAEQEPQTKDDETIEPAQDIRLKLQGEYTLASIVPANAVWIRVFFDHEGCLLWWAWQRHGEVLELLAEGASSSEAERAIVVANARFDLEVERVWATHEGRDLDHLDLSARDPLIHFLTLSDQVAPHQIWRQWTTACSEIRGSILQHLQQLITSGLAPMLGHLGLAVVTHLQGSDEQVPNWMWEEFRNGMMALLHPRWLPLKDCVDESQEMIYQRESWRRQALDAASERHQQIIGKYFQLDSLAKRLSSAVWGKTDLLFQVPGPLLAASIAWVPFGKDDAGNSRTVFERVASTSSIISLTLRHLSELEAQAPPRRVLSVHWDEPPKRSRAFNRLAKDVETVAQQSGLTKQWETWWLGDNPIATASNLRAALQDEDRHFGVIHINAHGIREKHGVRLAGGSSWHGEGADLRKTDLILLSACSVGRLQQDGSRDVEGLCAELAAWHGRTVVAARYPIADAETANFAAAVLRQYFREIDSWQPGRLSPPFARARSLNAVRRHFKSQDFLDVTRHLVSAFELYGFG